jgi:hypothetical protein
MLGVGTSQKRYKAQCFPVDSVTRLRSGLEAAACPTPPRHGMMDNSAMDERHPEQHIAQGIGDVHGD